VGSCGMAGIGTKPPGAKPDELFASKTAYVTSGSGMTPIDTATNKAGKPIKGLGGPIAITPNGKTVYAVSDSDTVTPINTATDKAGKPIKVGKGPNAIAITPPKSG
jgi:YVTN family beta-propeller protein